MKNLRLIARLDIKGPNVIKGIHLEGLRVVGNPNELAKKYYNQGVDELIFMDTVASLYGRNQLSEIINKATKNVFIPITVGGGIRNIEDVKQILRIGADKVAVNTAVVANPSFIDQIAQKFGSQCCVLSIEAKKIQDNLWEVMTNNGRERTGKSVVEWAVEGVKRGAGEVLITSVDKEGTRKGFDVELISAVTKAVSTPVIASGGMGEAEHLVTMVMNTNVDAVAMADILHFDRCKIEDIRIATKVSGIDVRSIETF